MAGEPDEDQEPDDQMSLRAARDQEEEAEEVVARKARWPSVARFREMSLQLLQAFRDEVDFHLSRGFAHIGAESRGTLSREEYRRLQQDSENLQLGAFASFLRGHLPANPRWDVHFEVSYEELRAGLLKEESPSL